MSESAAAAHDRETIREIQERVGVDQTGEMNTETLLAIRETLGLAQKLFIAKFARPSLTPPAGSQ